MKMVHVEIIADINSGKNDMLISKKNQRIYQKWYRDKKYE